MSAGDYPALIRQHGAVTIYWDMYLNKSRVGTPTVPFDERDRDRPGEPALRVRRAAVVVLDAVDRRERACRRRPRDAVVDDERAVPRQRPHVSQDARRARSQAVPARQSRALHGRRRRRLVAAGRGGRGHRARDLLQRQEAPRAGARARQPDDPPVAADRGRPLPRHRDPAVAARGDARIPDGQRRQRSRASHADAGLARHREVAGPRRASGRRRAQDLVRSGRGAGGPGRSPSRIPTKQPRRASGSGRARAPCATRLQLPARGGTRHEPRAS